ncbi:hypothetical protein BS17DRAFT_773407 [Gyrodon lividus]|nr:hypothetical protein BS17DRAFT_773407 [Gyrodon lividus]
MLAYRVHVGERTTESDFPQESLGRRVVNYAPSALIVLGFVLYPTVVGYLWIDAAFSLVGSWVCLPIAFVGIIALALAVILKSLPTRQDVRSSSSDLVAAESRRHRLGASIVTVCRAACVLWHLFLVLLLVLSIIIVPIEIINGDFLMLSLLFSVTCGWCYFIFSSYQWYIRCWYEKAIITQNEGMYGSTIFVSIPVFKLCGHFILVIRDRKYELRLDRSTNNCPVFREREIAPMEGEDIRNTFGHHWFIVGWTKRTDNQIKAAFTDVIESFGVYNRLHNNCRHFLQSGTMSILESTSIWHEDMLMVGASNDLTVIKMVIMMWRSIQKDLYRWYWTCRYGPDWEVLASKQFNDRAMVEDLMDHDFDPSVGSGSDRERDLTLQEHLLDFCFPWVFVLIGATVLLVLVVWVSNADSPKSATMPLGLLISVYVVSTCVSVILIIYGCCRV